MKKKIALVTGGAGFIGSHMVDLLLKKNIKVRVVDNLSGGHLSNLEQHKKNPLLSFENKDINKIHNKKLFADISYVFHFAGIGDIVPSIEDPIRYMETNVQGTINLLNLSRYANLQKFVYAASSSCYGFAKTPTKETYNISPQYPYALSKYLGENCCMHWSKVYNLPSISLRIFNAYGPRVRTTGAYGAVFGVFFKQKLSNKPLTIVGNGRQKRDFIYVTDIANAFYKAAVSKNKSDIYNLGTGQPKNIRYLASLISKNVIFIPKRPGEPNSTHANINKIKKNLLWRPTTTFEKGVSNMLLDIDKWKDSPLWDKKSIEKATKKWFEYLG